MHIGLIAAFVLCALVTEREARAAHVAGSGHRPAATAIALTAGRGTHQATGDTVPEVPKVSSRN
jgi:hypothetical protein